VNVHPGNVNKGLPTVMATMILNSPQTGAPLAVMGGTYLTSMRTGAAGGLAARLLAREDSRIVGLLGAGVQARTQLQALARIFSLELVKVFDISLERSQSLEKDCRVFLDCSYHITMDPGEVCDCDILVTTTPSRRPVVRDHWVKDGTHINAIGADAKGKQELDSSLLRRSKVVVDDRVQAVHSGEINVPIAQGEFSRDEIYAELGEIVAGKLPGRVDQKEITIFDSTGLAIQDVATASNVLLRAMTSGKGLKLRL
jgi:alanine dehydrogenase